MPSNQDEEQLYEDWKGFLQSSNRLDVQLAATEAVLSQISSSSSSSLRDDTPLKLLQKGFVPILAKTASANETEEDSTGLFISVNALQALVYLTSHGTTANQCVHVLVHGEVEEHETESDESKNDGVERKQNKDPSRCVLPRLTEIVLSTRILAAGATSSIKNENFRRKRINYALALMANVTRTDDGAIEFMGKPDIGEQLILKPETSATLDLLVARFLNTDYIVGSDNEDNSTGRRQQESDFFSEEEDEERETRLNNSTNDPYQHFAAVLMNLTQIDSGRAFCLKLHYNEDHTTTTVLQRLLPQLRSSNPLRRRGIAGLIRNCVLDGRDSVWWLLVDVKLLQHILYLLAGPEQLTMEEKKGMHPDLWLEGPTKKREPDHMTRLFIVQAVLLLCACGHKARECLRTERTSVVLKLAGMVEEQEDVSETINECMPILKDDDEKVDGAADGYNAVSIQEVYRKMTNAAAAGNSGVNTGDDYDDVD